MTKLPQEFALVPGITFTLPNGQPYQLIRAEPYRRVDGKEIALAVWTSNCADCGAPFEVRRPLDRAPENRRCNLHKRPGYKVSYSAKKPQANERNRFPAQFAELTRGIDAN